MPTISPQLLPVLTLLAFSVFMTFAWHGHLKFKGVSAFFEYWLAMPPNRWGGAVYNSTQLKTRRQQVIARVVFAGFAELYLKQPLGWDHAGGFALIAAGAFFVFHVV